MTETATRQRSGRGPLPQPPTRPAHGPLPQPPTDQAARLAQQPAQDVGLDARPETAPQVGVTVKKSSRFSLPFKNPFKKSEDTKQREAAAKAEKEKVLQARAQAKKQDIEARIQAKRLNEANAQQSAKVKAGFGAVTSKTEKPAELVRLTEDFAMWLDREKQARERARAEVLAGQEPTPELLAEAELAEEKAAESEWDLAPLRVRAFRPLRFDDFDKALNEVKQMLHESRSAEVGEVGALLTHHELTDGPVMTPQQATAQIRNQGALERRQVRAAQSKGLDPAALKAQDHAASEKRGDAFVKQHAGPLDTRQVSASEAAWTKADTEQSDLKDKYGHLDKALLLGKVSTGTGYAAQGAGQGIVQGTKGVVKGTSVVAGHDTGVAGIVGGSIDGVSGAFKFLGQVMSFVDQIADIKKGVADKNASIGAIRTAVQGLTTVAGMAKTSVSTAKAGLEVLRPGADAIAGLGNIGLPVISIVTSCLNILDGVLEMVPVSIRLADGVATVDQAVLERKFPLAAAYKRVNSRNAQLVEKATWKVGKGATQLGLSIGELASGGGMGGFTGAKLAVSIVDVAHTVGHKVYDVVSESNASEARKGFFVKHEEGASRDVFKHDIAASVDFLIVSARKGAPYAEKTLLTYGVTSTEVQAMPAHLLREKILAGLETSGDPKTVKEKFDSTKKDVMDFFGIDTAVRKDERTVLEKIGDYAAAPVKAVAKLPKVIHGELTKLVDKHRDAKKLIAAKNARGLKGNSTRGTGAVLEHMLRGRQGIEKSFAKVRQDMAEDGLDTSDMRTTADTKERAAKQAEQAERARRAESSYRIDQAFVDRVTRADMAGLYRIWDEMDRTDPEQIGNLQFFQHEVDRRLAAAGGVPAR